MSGPRDPAMALVRALAADAPGFVFEQAASCDWASATFSGFRHTIHCSVESGTAAEAWIAELPELEFALRATLLADLSVRASERRGDRRHLVLDALTIDAA